MCLYKYSHCWCLTCFGAAVLVSTNLGTVLDKVTPARGLGYTGHMIIVGDGLTLYVITWTSWK